MAWYDKRKNSPAVSGDEKKRDRVKRKSRLLYKKKSDNRVTLNDTRDILLVQNRPDTFFTVIYILLLALGAILSFSAGSAYAEEVYGSGFHFVMNHIKHLAVGVVASAFFYFFSQPRYMRIISVAFYLGALFLLVLVLVMGVKRGGDAQRWLVLGPLTIQPSELGKTGLILAISLFMTRFEGKINSKGFSKDSFLYGLVFPGLIFLVVCLLVLFENHFSGVIIIAALGLVMLFLGGTYLGWFAAFVPLLPVLFIIIRNTEYAWARIESFLNKGSNSLTDNWQSTQGLYAIGTGGLFGVGLGESSLKYGYVSQPQNDFVFTIICEEVGFFGAAAILLLFFALVVRGVILGVRSPDKFSSLVIIGLSFKLAIHTILNVGVVSGILPNTGISLPFFSSGGSATLSQMIDMGIIMGLSRFCTQKN
ncbi:MAG: FtsW/RodA/SpoVE family cell cycle protein [Eubacteriales bacterium]